MAFDAEWLALREPADHAARDAGLLSRAAEVAGSAPRILDLACGTGSTFRAFSAHGQTDTTWRMIDNDADLLEHVGAPDGVETYQLDIADPARLPLEDVSLVTASALLDLVSEDWLEVLVATLRARHLPFYAALSYDGRMIWTPHHQEDQRVTDAFNAHQRSDKGFGPALGPDAAGVAQTLFGREGYEVTVGRSDWRFSPDASALKETLTRDIAAAAEDAGYKATAQWHAQRNNRALRVGHLDLLALPPGVRSH
ncbi:MAG: class I SAM-dependent methyltransferase [Pseudomonadota bacterium]